METAKLKKFTQFARRSLIDQITAKLNLVLAEGSAARREQPKAITELEKQLHEHDREQVVERIAYTWFNRFCALRFMDVNRYTRIGVVSPAEGQFQPEILAEAKMGHIDEEMVPEKIRQQIFASIKVDFSNAWLADESVEECYLAAIREVFISKFIKGEGFNYDRAS